LAGIFALALVLIKLLLEASFGILDAHQCSNGRLECFTANRTGSDRWYTAEVFYQSKTTFCHARSFPQAEELDSLMI
jgi:hypothetical protein